MTKKSFTRRDFIGKTTAGIAGTAVLTGIPSMGASCKRQSSGDIKYSKGDFANVVEQLLPGEDLYDYHKRLSTDPVHIPRRDQEAKPKEDEMIIPEQGWKLIWNSESSAIVQTAVLDFKDYLDKSQQIKVELLERNLSPDWQNLSQSIVVGTRAQLPGCGLTLNSPKDYEIAVSPERIVVCGYDERGAMFGLYNLEARMNLREGPFLPKNLQKVRHSLYESRMVLSWMGWMEWPDQLFAHLVHDGYDSIFASVYANPNGDRTTAESSTDFYSRILYRVRKQDPSVIRNLVNRASRYGIKVYTPIIYQYLGTRKSELGLRKLVREIVQEFPEIQGYILLTEGFWYKKWGGGHGASKEYMKEWARNWSKAVGIVEDECHRINSSIEIIPWEYNIDFRPQNSDVKKYFIQQLPAKTIPLLTWENGKSYEIDGMQCYLRDYSLNQIGPAEVTEAQINEAEKRKMKVYSKVDTFASWQFGTIPYLPCPNQWYDRYMALEKFGVKGTLESWSSGYKPNFISEMRAWTCWSDAPSKEELFTAMAARIFGNDQKETVIKAWEHFSQAIKLVPDTGPNMGTNNAIGNPIFLEQPPARTATYKYSWADQNKRLPVNPYWPFTTSRMVFYPDFTNKINKAELYARRATGIQVGEEIKVLPIFLKYLQQASDQMEEGLKLYRDAATNSSESKRQQAVREVVVAEQLQRMMQSDYAILKFEDLRLKLINEKDNKEIKVGLDLMEDIIQGEIARTEFSLLAASKDSRLGFQFEQDYVYTPYSLKEKLAVLQETLNEHIPKFRTNLS
jgi:hypothetical protein